MKDKFSGLDVLDKSRLDDSDNTGVGSVQSAAVKFAEPSPPPSEQDAMAAVRTLISYIGDDPARDGLIDTPQRVVKSFKEIFAGYNQPLPETLLNRVFLESTRYNEPVLIRDIPFYSHCEHHMMVFSGTSCIAYLPDKRVVGLSKISRLIDMFARRLQTQENLTLEIAEAIDRGLKPLGVAVMMKANHQCMSMRGVAKHDSETVTYHFTGRFNTDATIKNNFIMACQ